MTSEAFKRLDSEKKSWIGWKRQRLIDAFGQPVTARSQADGEWLGFKVDDCSVTVHLVGDEVVSGEVWAS